MQRVCNCTTTFLNYLIMSYRKTLRVPKNGLFYFKCDQTTSILQLNKIQKVINGSNVSKGSKVLLRYGKSSLEAEIIAVDGMFLYIFSLLAFMKFFFFSC